MNVFRSRRRTLILSLLMVAATAFAQPAGPEGPKTPSSAAPAANPAAPPPANPTAVPAAPPQSKGPNVEAISKDFGDLRFWGLLVVAVVFGGLGGLVYELLVLQGQIERPHKTEAEDAVQGSSLATWKFTYDLGVVSRIIIGALAAVAVLWVLSPPSGFALLAVSVVAGSAGSAIFRSLEDRLLAVVSQKDAAETRKKADTAKSKVEEIGKGVASLQAKLGAGAGAAMGAGYAAAPVDVAAELQDTSRLVAEAKAIFETIR